MSLAQPTARQAPEAISPFGEAWAVFRRNPPAMFGTILLIAIAAFSSTGPSLPRRPF